MVLSHDPMANFSGFNINFKQANPVHGGGQTFSNYQVVKSGIRTFFLILPCGSRGLVNMGCARLFPPQQQF